MGILKRKAENVTLQDGTAQAIRDKSSVMRRKILPLMSEAILFHPFQKNQDKNQNETWATDY